MLGNRPMSAWIAQYALSHQHPVNRFCHTVGIPLIAASVPLFVAAVFVHGFWPVPLGFFVVGWAFQSSATPLRGSRRSSSKTGASCSLACGGGSRSFEDGRSRVGGSPAQHR